MCSGCCLAHSRCLKDAGFCFSLSVKSVTFIFSHISLSGNFIFLVLEIDVFQRSHWTREHLLSCPLPAQVSSLEICWTERQGLKKTHVACLIGHVCVWKREIGGGRERVWIHEYILIHTVKAQCVYMVRRRDWNVFVQMSDPKGEGNAVLKMNSSY